VAEPVKIDDNRRFRTLWRELVFARLLVTAAACGAFVAVYATLGDLTAFDRYVTVGLVSIFMAAPSAAAKKGKRVVPLVAAAVALGIFPAILSRDPTSYKWVSAVAGFAAIGGAIGVVEGLFERALATTYCGLLGGSAAGALLGSLYDWAKIRQSFLAFMVLFATIHVGVGLSLALGRWIRDLPKRGASQGEGVD